MGITEERPPTREELEKVREELERTRAQIAQGTAELHAAGLDSERRRSRLLQQIFAVTAPPIVGLAILALVLAGAVSDAVMRSSAATSTALIVGALLMVVPPLSFAWSPDRYAEYQTALERRLLKATGIDREVSET